MYNLDPITREEKFLAKMAGRDVETPEPITRLEQFYDDAAKGGGGGGSGSVTISGHGATPQTIPSGIDFFDRVGLTTVSAVKIALGSQSAVALIQAKSGNTVSFRGTAGTMGVTEATFTIDESAIYPTALSIGGTDYTAYIPNIDWELVIYNR